MRPTIVRPTIMRPTVVGTLAVLALSFLWPMPTGAAAVIALPATELSGVMPIDSRCGPGRHYVRAHRTKSGQTVAPGCVPNRKRK